VRTEEEMKKTWCPDARVLHVRDDTKVATGLPSYNRVSNKDTRAGRQDNAAAGSTCLGSGCSQWVWEVTAGDEKPTRGFCGRMFYVPGRM
jgi:hypothetical protein